MHNLPNVSIDVGEIHLEYSFLFIIFLILVKTSGLLIYFSLVFPNLLKETMVKDRLHILRKIIFICINAYSVAILANMIISTCLFFDCVNQNTSIVASLIQAFAVLLIYEILAMVYNRKY